LNCSSDGSILEDHRSWDAAASAPSASDPCSRSILLSRCSKNSRLAMATFGGSPYEEAQAPRYGLAMIDLARIGLPRSELRSRRLPCGDGGSPLLFFR
jgi:hypothetical protein